MGQYEESWEMYITNIETPGGDVPCAVFVDMGRAEDDGQSRFPLLARVGIAVHETSDNGLPTMDELNALQDLEELVTERLEGIKAIPVGAVTTPARRDVVFYLPKGTTVPEKLLADIPADRRGDPFVHVEEDAEWGFYFEVLYPSADQYRMMQDQQVLAGLEEGGDDASIPRQIEHFAYFEDKAGRDAFAASAQDQGFEIASVSEPSEDDEAFCVRLYQTIELESDAIFDATQALSIAAEDAGGEYDGWGSPVMKPGKKAK